MNRPALFRRPLRISLPWLVWLALLLPLAQTAAAWHELQHTAEAAGQLDASQKAAHTAACGQCLASAAMHGTGLAPGVEPVRHPALGQVLRARGTGRVHAGAPPLGYLSRAPPTVSC
jgi:hypothetical protein